MTKKVRTGNTGLTRGMQDAQRDTLDQAQKATGQKNPTKAGQYYRKSYLLTLDLIDTVQTAADKNKVGISEFVRWALSYVVDGVNAGTIEIPTVEKQSRKIQF